MKNMVLTAVAVLVGLFYISPRIVDAHCEVPCGIYGDQARFVQMLEDQKTIAKAIDQIREIANGMSDGASAKGVNQSVRWITAKEDHATKIQHTISQYFMTQRIKADGDNYGKKLMAAHAVLVSAMKCKQDASPDTATALRKSILDFYRASEGKEPGDLH